MNGTLARARGVGLFLFETPAYATAITIFGTKCRRDVA